MSEYTPTTEEVRLEYMAVRWGKNGTASYEARAEFDRWLAEHDRQIAERALTDAARQMPFPADPYGCFDHESLRAAFVQNTNWLRARAEVYRKERKDDEIQN